MRIFLIIFFTSLIFSGEVELLDGSIIKGEILKVDDVSVTIKVSYSDIPIEIDKNDIRNISFLKQGLDKSNDNPNSDFFIIMEAGYSIAYANIKLDYDYEAYYEVLSPDPYTVSDSFDCGRCYSLGYPMLNVFAGIQKKIPLIGISRIGIEAGFHENGSRISGRIEKLNLSSFEFNVSIALGFDNYYREKNSSISEEEVFYNLDSEMAFTNTYTRETAEALFERRYNNGFDITRMNLEMDTPFKIAISKDFILKNGKFTPKYELGYTYLDEGSAVHTISLGYHF